MIQITLTHTTDESPLIRTFHFTPERPLEYQAGQFIELHLPHANTDNKGDHRWFTLSSSPTEHELAITVKKPPAASTFKQALWQLHPGDTAGASDPLGDFVLPLDTTIPLVWVAGGIGITPFRSLATWLADQHDNRQIQVIHSTSQPGERIFTKQIKRLPTADFHAINTIEQSRLDGQDVLRIIQQSVAAAGSALFYVSGPETMVDVLAHDLRQLGLARERIITDAFLGYK